ncbi:MAG: hypothetical protein MJK04_05695 [Psychrosphaera sp.]|nr:hypothetical protein [Psychrosphaera sp.]
MSQNPYESGEAELHGQPVKKSNPIIRIIKRIFMVIGGFFTLMIVLLIIGSFASPSYDELDKEAIVIFDKVIPVLGITDFDSIEGHFHTEFSKKIGDEKITGLFEEYKKLGEYQSHQPFTRSDCRFEAGTTTFSECQYQISTQYSVPANVKLTIIKFKDEPAKIIRIFISSDIYNPISAG